MRITRLLDRPVIEPATHPSIGSNIHGPSLVRTPAWLPDLPGSYLLTSPITTATRSGWHSPTS